MTYQERTLTCQDCGQTFPFSVEDQEYHAQKGYTNDPKRCPPCRQSRRNEGGSGGSSYGGNARQMHPAVCAQCGCQTEVPFQPRGDRPVYCSKCYNERPERATSRRY